MWLSNTTSKECSSSQFRDPRWHVISLQILGHPRGQVVQSWALLHHPGWNMSGLRVHLQPYRQATHNLLLPPAAGNRPVSCHELLCSGHQGILSATRRQRNAVQVRVMLYFLWNFLTKSPVVHVIYLLFLLNSTVPLRYQYSTLPLKVWLNDFEI